MPNKFNIQLDCNEDILSRALGVSDDRTKMLTDEMANIVFRDKSYLPLQKLVNKCESIEEVILIAACFSLTIPHK